MDIFIKEHEYKLDYAPTTEVFAEWLKYNPKTEYTTLAKFSRALNRYGYTTQSKRFTDGVRRAYIRFEIGSPVIVVCWCGDEHEHRVVE